MTHPALYISAQRIAFIPTRIVRAFNDNVAAVLSSAADGADVAHNAPCAVLATSAAVSLSSHEVPCAE